MLTQQELTLGCIYNKYNYEYFLATPYARVAVIRLPRQIK